jgi:hypothetical protein
MKTYGEVDAYIHSRILDLGPSWSSVVSFTPGERALGTYWLGVWAGPRTCLVDMGRRKILLLPGFELRPLGRPVRCYTGSQ